MNHHRNHKYINNKKARVFLYFFLGGFQGVCSFRLQILQRQLFQVKTMCSGSRCGGGGKGMSKIQVTAATNPISARIAKPQTYTG